MLRRDNFNEVLEMLNEAEKITQRIEKKAINSKRNFIVRLQEKALRKSSN